MDSKSQRFRLQLKLLRVREASVTVGRHFVRPFPPRRKSVRDVPSMSLEDVVDKAFQPATGEVAAHPGVWRAQPRK